MTRHSMLAFALLTALLLPAQGWAARQTNGTNQSLQSVSTVNLGGASQIAISLWLYWDAFSNNDMVALESSSFSTGSGTDSTFTIVPNDGSGVFLVAIRGDTGASFANITRPSAGVYHHYVINIDAATVNDFPSIYFDAISQAITHTGNDVTALAYTTRFLNVMSRDNSSLFAAGRVAELAIWTNINLSGTDVTNLFAGVSPLSVQGGNLVHYWRVCGDTAPELPTIGTVNMTVNGATKVAHPSAVDSCTSRRFMLLR